MDMSIHRVRRLIITEKMSGENPADHCYLIIQTSDGEKLRISLFDWNGEIANEGWLEGVFA